MELSESRLTRTTSITRYSRTCQAYTTCSTRLSSGSLNSPAARPSLETPWPLESSPPPAPKPPGLWDSSPPEPGSPTRTPRWRGSGSSPQRVHRTLITEKTINPVILDTLGETDKVGTTTTWGSFSYRFCLRTEDHLNVRIGLDEISCASPAPGRSPRPKF